RADDDVLVAQRRIGSSQCTEHVRRVEWCLVHRRPDIERWDERESGEHGGAIAIREIEDFLVRVSGSDEEALGRTRGHRDHDAAAGWIVGQAVRRTDATHAPSTPSSCRVNARWVVDRDRRDGAGGPEGFPAPRARVRNHVCAESRRQAIEIDRDLAFHTRTGEIVANTRKMQTIPDEYHRTA